ncbi:MAG: 1-deoxy-D-xylulose-5-phosphate synthase [Gammaproteobacteria bacterium]|nr:1-deoxy-D-xylulose-5-phosphate synthase [Gammaproteobacteria bacterium]
MPESSDKYAFLKTINSPAELRQLDKKQLPELADQLRDYLLHSVANTGGHLSAGLGTVELTIALHYVYNTPDDRLIWDVGHQTYPHKMLTGRREAMATMRQHQGLSGFPKRSESEYDCFGVGHSSTSISAAAGMSIASALKGEKRKTVAVIGDGAMTAGMAFEALNHAGDSKADMLVVLNDNEMSISPNVGALSKHLAKLLSGRFYSSMRESSKKVMQVMPPVWEFAKRAEEHMKGMVVPGTLFEELGFQYFGPIDGHDIPTLITMLNNMKKMDGPKLLHIVTQKGKGFPPAEQDPGKFHGVTAFDPATGTKLNPSPASAKTYTQIFSDWLCDMAAQDNRLIGITPAMLEGSGLVEFAKQYPERYIDVGIAEQHAVTLAAGLACEGMKPVVAIYSTFLQRAYDQLIHDVAIQNLDVLFAIDRGGLVGADGATHAGSFDLSFMRCIPNMLIMAPSDGNQCRQMLYTGFLHKGPAAVRYPRGAGPDTDIEAKLQALEIGKAELRRAGKEIAILAFGSMLAPAIEAAEALNATVVDMRFIKPLDENMVLEMASSHELIVTIEENATQGGAGSAVNECLLAHKLTPRMMNLGLPDQFIDHGDTAILLAECGLNKAGIIHSIESHYRD